MTTRAEIVELLRTRDLAVARALLVLNERQTASEQASESTHHRNGQGFRPCHARMGTSMAEFFGRRGYLSPKQIAYWRAPMKDGKMRIEIYAGQLLEVAAARAQTRAIAQQTAEAPVASVKDVLVDGDAKGSKDDIGNLREQLMVLKEMFRTETARGANAERIDSIESAITHVQNCIDDLYRAHYNI
jgi:hypothetical protein